MITQKRIKRAEARFWSRVRVLNPNQCWEWQGVRESFGYGRFWFNGRTQTAQRVAWQLSAGDIPQGLCVLHRCDNPPCVNPSHLFLGTKSANAADRHVKGRTNWARGDSQPGTNLTEDSIRAIRSRYAAGALQRDLAAAFGVSRSSIQLIVARKRWAHVQDGRAA